MATTIRIAGTTAEGLGEANADDVRRFDILLEEELEKWLETRGIDASADVVLPDWPHLFRGIEVYRSDVAEDPGLTYEQLDELEEDLARLHEQAWARFCA